MPDMVNHPPHYTAGPIEAIDAIAAALGPEGFQAYCRGTAIKYAWRAGRKDDATQDLEKGAWYLNRGAKVEVDPDLTPDKETRLLDEIATLKQRLKDEQREWMEAQDSLRAEWLKVVDALGQIVPVIPGETTLGMVERVQKTVAGLSRKADDGPITLCMPGSWLPAETVGGLKDRLNRFEKALQTIATDTSGSIGAADWMILVAQEALAGEP